MLPLRDETRHSYNFPVATISIIGLNVVVFILEILFGDSFVNLYSLVPSNIVNGRDLYTLVTSMFLHAGLLHIAGNMIYLWVFGPDLEGVLGARPFAIFYFVCGLIANVAQIAIDPTSTIPSLGASGAIAGVLGGFIIEFPTDQIKSLVPLGPVLFSTRIPAILLLGGWFALQLLDGVGQVASQAQDGGGVAFFAHIGGFIAGMVLVKVFLAFSPSRQASEYYG